MSERIRELADQLGPVATIGNWGRVEWSDNVYPQIGDRMYAAIDLEKFAELIVRECAKEAFKYTWNEENYQHYNDNGWDCLPGDLKSHIEEHFGVE